MEHRKTRMPRSSNVFEVCRGITAREVALHHGICVTRRGGRQWACCPLHQEREASLLLDARGRFHCFGCGAHGDAVDLHAALRGITAHAAALELMALLRPHWYP